ncbi:hypothetical protein MWN34_00880 [Ancylobacter sp. 6x-1]|uniref:Uncharacterized protein n=1 Tax=Ancylobacter crimeensis TaxID=2579147 RepID=A0ABT0D689_9HYPH|nr:hypothetical protein [Ancylobacter crimeensis]MCK0195460.1 hypothetical protein [Ancylobacter crimeensis]
MNALIETGALPSSVRLNPVNRCPQRVVLEADLDTFMRRFVSLTGLSRETGIHFRRLAADLGRSGITPAFDPGQVKATFYERAALRGHAPAT